MANLGIVTLHGMGKTETNYASKLFEEIRDNLGPDLVNHVKTESIFYQKILQENQENYFRKVKRRLRWDDLREFMLYGFSDAASLESKKDGDDSPYFQAQQIILDALRSLYRGLSGAERKVIIIAQSLGGQVISNYLWDATKPTGKPSHGVWSVAQNFDSPEEEEFCRGERTVRLFTTGCNIPLFIAGMDEDKIKPISPRHPEFEWHNYYDKDDVLGWPLQKLNDDYEALVKDHPINAGLITGFTPLSHQNYWRDRDFLKPLMRHIKRSL